MSERDVEIASALEGTTGSGRRVIAAIGLDRYRHWPRLSNAVRDATAASALFQRLGFEEITAPLLDERATREAIQSLVTDDLTALGPDDSLVLFYAGHGGTRKHRPGGKEIKTAYLIPIDASSSQGKVFTWIELEAWLRAVSLLPARHILVVLDACHSGIALDPILKWRDIGSWQGAPLPALQARCSRRIITSVLDDQVALDSGPVHGHSLFTGCLLEGLTGGIRSDRGAVTTGSELGLYVQRRVQTYSGARQTPDFGTFAFDDRGEMVIPLAIERARERPEKPETADSPTRLDLMDQDDASLPGSDLAPRPDESSGTAANADGKFITTVEPASTWPAGPTSLTGPDDRPAPAVDVESPADDPAAPSDLDDVAVGGPELRSGVPVEMQAPALIEPRSEAAQPVLAESMSPPRASSSGASGGVRVPREDGHHLGWRIVTVFAGAMFAVALIARGMQPDGLLREDCPPGMVGVPAGTFSMGSPESVGGAGEHPQHEVTLSAYCIDRTEVMVKAYAACVAAKGCPAAPRTAWANYSAADVERYSRFCNREDRPDHPRNCVDWNQAAAYCTWAGNRLPTEAEWEYAARGSDGREYPWGNDAPSASRLNACGSECVAMAKRELHEDLVGMYDASDRWETTAPVGSFPDGTTPSGVLDMAGNVWEWTADWYESYSVAAATNPRLATMKVVPNRVIRGGGWDSADTADVRATRRYGDGPLFRRPYVGFRCARGLPGT